MKRELTPSVKSKTKDDDASSTSSSDSSSSSDVSPKSSPVAQPSKEERRISTTSMDDVDLVDEGPATASIKSRSSTTSESAAKAAPPPPPPSKGFPKLSWGSTPPPVPAKDPTPPPQTQRRGPFNWFSRASTSSVPSTTSPPASTSGSGFFSARRNTTSSTTTTFSSITTPTQNGPSLPTITTPVIQAYLNKPFGQDLIQQRMEATKDNLSHADANQLEETNKGINSLRISFQKIRDTAGEVPLTPVEPPTSGGIVGMIGQGLGIASLGSTAGSSVKESGEAATATEKGVGDTPGSVHTEFDDSRPGTSGGARGEDEIDWEFWSSVVEDYYSVASKSSHLLTEKVQAGIPATIRGTVWQSIARSKNESIEKIYTDFNALPQNHMTQIPVHRPPSAIIGESTPSVPVECKTVSQLEKEIKKDMGQRTSFANYKGFRQEGLMGLMKAYAIYDPEVGYVQGMAFLGAPLLLNMTEEEAFCILVELMRTYSLRDMFTPGMKGLHLRLYQYDRLLEDLCPALAIHLNRRKAQSSLYATQWFLTLFAYKFPLQLVLRVYDLVIAEGVEGAVLKFGIALMKKNEAALRQIDSLEVLLPFLREKLFDAYLDRNPSQTSLKEAGFFGNGGEKEIYKANELVKDACDVIVTPEMLHKYTVDWVEMDKREMEELMEKETLKSQNAILNSKVKKLSKEIESLTHEHVQVATDLVHKKMHNSQLLDENEGLKGEVDELRVVVEKQPKEVEARLKDEMDRIMKRNLEVHNENQSLEDQMREMEMELVGTKMSLAEITEAHELLKTRWNELRKALGD
ncbi:Carabin [Dactylella cylindrospora]|nr:Carabin [Dactylella cylindrospora]